MTDDDPLGKVDASFFERDIYPRLGAEREDVLVEPQHGVDFGAVTVGDAVLVLATDPLSVLPDLGVERAGRLALEVVTTDVAVSGIAPAHVAVTLTLPPGMDDDTAGAVWAAMASHAESLGASIAATHVGRYPNVESSWVGGATVMGVGDPDALVRPDGARPGDALVVSTGPAAEVTGLFSWLFPDALDLSAETLATASERVDDIGATADALAAHAAGDVTAMHDATEGGLRGALVEMATGAGVRFEVHSEAVPVQPGVEPLCDALELDPWAVSSAGSLVVAVDPADAEAVAAALRDRGTPAAVVGEVHAGEGVFVDGERVEKPAFDPGWEAMRDLSGGE